jgi:hypothetical protein
MTEEVSRVAAPWALRVVEGDEVDIGRFELAEDLPEIADVECFDVEDGESVDVVAGAGVDDVLGCCV